MQGNTVRAKAIGRDGAITQYSRLLIEAREEAAARMMRAAEAKGANAVVCVRFTTSAIMDGASEILAYGTAVTAE